MKTTCLKKVEDDVLVKCINCGHKNTRNNFYDSVNGKAKCPNCQSGAVELYEAERNTKDGYDHICKACRRYNRLQWRKKNPDKYKRENVINGIVKQAVKTGKIVKPDRCSQCKKNDRVLEAHHEDYYNVFDVIWVCKQCHTKLDNERLEGN